MHPVVSDTTARGIVRALVDNGSLGVALLSGRPWRHTLVNRTYERLVGRHGTLGRSVSDVLPEDVVAALALDEDSVVLQNLRFGRGTPGGGSGLARHVSLTVLAVRGDGGGVLLLGEDVTAHVHELETAKLFILLAAEIAGGRGASAAICRAARRAAGALDADNASIFLVGVDGRSVVGALSGWDWTRTSFHASLADWPMVARAIGEDRALYFTTREARGAEAGWFERHGIAATICAPMSSAGRALGVLFFDYFDEPDRADLALAKSVADHCAVVFAHTPLELR